MSATGVKNKLIVTNDDGTKVAFIVDGEFGPWLTRTRNSLGMSMAKLATQCDGISRQAIYGWERLGGHPRPEHLLKLMAVLKQEPTKEAE